MGNAAITSLPKDPMLIQAMVTKLRATYVARQKHAEISFQSEMFGIVQIISTDSRSLYHGSKSDILKGFKNETQPKMHENNSALIVDLSVIVKKIGQQTFRTFKELATNMYKHIMSLGVEFKLKESTLSQTDILKMTEELEASWYSMTRQNSLMILLTISKKIAKTRITLISI